MLAWRKWLPFADNITMTFYCKNLYVAIQISLQFVLEGVVNSKTFGNGLAPHGQQSISSIDIDPDLQSDMVSAGHNVLT